jgi:DNA-binding MarR family transcriptional regulator
MHDEWQTTRRPAPRTLVSREGSQRLIAIESDPSDGRSRILRLTKAGNARFQRAQKHWAEAQKRFERVYGGRQASQLRENLRAVVASELGPFDAMAAE